MDMTLPVDQAFFTNKKYCIIRTTHQELRESLLSSVPTHERPALLCFLSSEELGFCGVLFVSQEQILERLFPAC